MRVSSTERKLFCLLRAFFILAVLLLSPRAVHAQACQVTCNQAGGCINKPTGFPIYPPWANALSYAIDNGYANRWHCLSDYYSLDFSLPNGTDVYALASGRVMSTGSGTVGYGNFVMVDHQNGYQSLYAHLQSRPALFNGQFVDSQTVIGKSGNSGTDTYHLHVTLYQGAHSQGDASAKAVVPAAMDSCYKNGIAGSTCDNFSIGNTLTRSGSCGNRCTQCMLTVRNDLLPVFSTFGWSTACSVRDAIVNTWCGATMDFTACDAIAGSQCKEVCTDGGCGNQCTQCINQLRPDIIAYYATIPWDTSCGNRNNVISNWCGIAPGECRALRRNECASVCPYAP